MDAIGGTLDKMRGRPAGTEVAYALPLGERELPLNPYLGRRLVLRYEGEIRCVACGRKTAKSFGQGHCYPCMRSLARCDLCIVKPELCHHAAGTCREPEWGLTHCMQPHCVYLANSSGVKVGITRQTQLPTRWIDQGARQALPIFRVDSRHRAGLLEVLLKAHVADKTDWRALLKGEAPPADLAAKRDELFALCRDQLAREGVAPIPDGQPVDIRYPVLEYPAKVSALSLDKSPEVGGRLLGIKGQYLIFDRGVLNVRKFAGYRVEVEMEG